MCRWVNPKICELYGIAGSAAEAWQAEGGGAFSRKPDMSAVPAHLRAKGWSEAKAFAATMLKKNPNTYVYRHVAPHEQQVGCGKQFSSGTTCCAAAAFACWHPAHGSTSGVLVLGLLSQGVSSG